MSNRQLHRRSARLVLVAAAALLLALAAAPPAGAKLVRTHHGRRIAIVPRPRTLRAQQASNRAQPAPQLDYVGGAVLHTNETTALYWDPSGHPFSSSRFESLVNQFFGDVQHDNGTWGTAYSVASQYGDTSGGISYQSSFLGAKDDTSAYPSSGCTPAYPQDVTNGDPCLTDQQLQAEIGTQINAHQLPAPSSNRIYFVYLPKNVVTCFDSNTAPNLDPAACSDDYADPNGGGFCGYHGQTGGHPYAVVLDEPGACTDPSETHPNDANADSAVNTTSHEHVEAVTDPDPNSPAWYDTNSGLEMADICETDYGPALGGSGSTAYNQLIAGHGYGLQEEWSNVDNACVQYYPSLSPGFGFNAGVAGQPTGFFGAGQANPHAAYSWSFGDGGSGGGAGPSHVYGWPGNYNATLTLTTDGGRSASTSRNVGVGYPQPTASFGWSPQYPRSGTSINFNAGGSSAPYASINSYSWDFGDGGTASGPTPTHTFAHNGDHWVTVTVFTSAGGSAYITHRVPVGDPAASFRVTGARQRGSRLTFIASASDPDGHISSYRWNFGDGSYGSGRQTTHVFRSGGPRDVTLTVTDSDGTQTKVTQQLQVSAARRHARLSTHRRARASAHRRARISARERPFDELVAGFF